MIAALHKYINEHRKGRRPAAEQPANAVSHGQGRGSAAAGPRRAPGRPAAAAKPAATASTGQQAAAQQAAPQRGRKRKKEQEEANLPSGTGTERTSAQGKKTRAKQPARFTGGGASAAAGNMDSDGTAVETGDEAPATERVKGKKKPKPRSKGSAADIGNVALGDGGSAALDREPSDAGAPQLHCPSVVLQPYSAYSNDLRGAAVSW